MDSIDELKALRDVEKAARAILEKCDREGLLLGGGRNHPNEREGPMTKKLRAALNKVPNAELERGTLLENVMDKRIGRFAMSRQLVERDPDTARAVMGRCIVVRCEMMYAHDTLEYMALSPDFDEVPQGMIAPEYDVIISDGGKRIEFKRSNVDVTGAGKRRDSDA